MVEFVFIKTPLNGPIAKKQQEYDQATVNFLANKFTGEFYAFVINILSGVYRYFLQQATSVAQQAQSQLEFERQEMTPNFNLTDYWQPHFSSSPISASTPTSDFPNGGSKDNKTTEMRGITGSSRLLQDFYELDQFAFEKDKRKLNLVQTFSLAQLFPLEFQLFRETGVLQFNTPIELYDRRFPGHYLRLIKRVRTSIVALIPQIQGISATLTSSGISRVVTKKEDIFQSIEITRESEMVALTSPINATGVFEMDMQSEMLLPFESNGVATSWELRMPKAANPFDYGTISDVLFTVEYTALHNPDYGLQIIKSLDTRITGQRPFSFKDQFPDQWYYLHNPEQVEDKEKQMTIAFSIERADFPINIANLHLGDILLYLIRVNNKSFEVAAHLSKIDGSSITIDAGQAVSEKGIISTTRGSWRKIIDEAGSVKSSLFGEYEISFRSDDAAKYKEIIDHFKNGDIEDIIFITTYKGDTPPW